MTKIEINHTAKRKPESRAEKNAVQSLHKERDSERGAAMLVALIVIAAFIVLATAATKTVTAISREAERIEQIRQEKARAEYYMSMAEATLKYDVRQTYNDFQVRGKQKELQLRGDGKLPMFDPLTVSSSRPLLTLDGEHTGESPQAATSLYGSVEPWSVIAIDASREYISSKMKEKGIVAPDSLEILSFKEVYRRLMPGVSEPIYAFRYTARAHAGEFGEVVKEDQILLGPAITEDFPTAANCSDLTLAGVANPANVAWGSATSLELTYANAERLNIYNSGGSAIFNRTVTNEPTPRTVAYTTAPLSGPTSFVGEAVRGGCQVQVPIIVGVTFNQNISYTVNGVQTVNIIEGENVRYDWNVTNAAAGYTTSYITYGSDATQYHTNVFSNSITVPGPTVSTTSTLHARDTRYNGGAEQTVTVNINVCRLPRIQNFSVNPATVTQGGNQSVQFTWQTQDAVAVRIIRLSDNQEIYSGNQSSGTFTLAQPQASTQYRLEAISSCGAPAAVSDVTVNVQPPACQTPNINSFNVNPATVPQGGNQTIVFSWNVSGTVDSQNIDQGIGSVSGNSHSILQPNVTTTYTYTVVGCGQTRQAQSTVTVTSTPINIIRNDSNLMYYDQIGDFSTDVYTYQKGISFVSFNNSTGELIYDAIDYNLVTNGGGPGYFNWNQGDMFYPLVVNNTDPCFQANGQPTPGCTFTRGLSPQLMWVTIGTSYPIRIGRFRVITSPNTGIPYIEFTSPDFRNGGGTVLYHN